MMEILWMGMDAMLTVQQETTIAVLPQLLTEILLQHLVHQPVQGDILPIQQPSPAFNACILVELAQTQLHANHVTLQLTDI